MQVTTLASGSQGNCTHIKDGETEILIDAGISGRATEYALNAIGSQLDRIAAIFVTHEHIDHVRGIEQLTRKSGIPVVMNAPTAKAYAGDGSGKSVQYIKLLPPGRSCCVGSLCVHSYATPHDSAASMGFVIDNKEGAKTAVATDIGYLTDEVKEALVGCHTIVIESNHDEKMLIEGGYPQHLKQRILSKVGHLSNRSCADYLPYLVEKGARNIILYHLSRENNLPEVALKTALESLSGAGYTFRAQGGEFLLYAAPQKDNYRSFAVKCI